MPKTGNTISYQDVPTATETQMFINALENSEVSRVDFYGCKLAKNSVDLPNTSRNDDGAAFLQSIAIGSGAIVTGYTTSVGATWLPLFGGNFWMVKGGSREFFPK